MTRRQFFLFSCLLLAFPFSVKADEKLVELVKKTKPAVVLIQTFNDNNQPIGQGSGFFINNKGHIVTNHHVLEGAYRATVKTSSGIEYPVEGIIAKDADADIAKLVVKVPDANTPFLNLSEVVPSEGQDVIVIGNPLGLESTVSSGIVSAVRDIPAFGKILQITAPVSPGSSGSPVLNNNGEVIGIATLIVTKGQNLNFAVPSDKIIALKEIPQTSLTNAIPPDSNNARQFYQKGLKELWQENWSAAITYFQKAKEKNLQDPNIWFYLGYCYDKLGRYQDAIESWKEAIRIAPDLAEAHFNLGITYYNLSILDSEFTKEDFHRSQEFVQKEIEPFKQAIRIKPDWPEAHYCLGEAYAGLGRYEEAIESYRRAIDLNKDFVSAYDSLGLAYYALDRFQEAIIACKMAIKIKPNFSGTHYRLGLYYISIGDKGSALEEYKILKTLDIDQANKLFNLIYK